MKRPPFRPVAAVTLLGATLGGCALQPVYQRPPAAVAAGYPVGAAYAAPTPGDVAAIGWREFLRDPRLQRLIESGLRNNRDLRVAVLNVERVRAQYALQKASQLPQVGLDASAEAGRAPRNSGVASASGNRNFAAGLTASWELDFFGRLASLSEAAQQQYLASADAQRAATILLISQIADQYLATVAGDALLAVTEQTRQAAAAALKIVELQFNTGTASDLDVQLAQTALDQAEANLAAQTRQRAQAENALVLLVGEPLAADLPAPLPLAQQAILAAIPAGLPSTLLTNRPDIAQAEAQLRAANANIGAARAAFFPNISLTGAGGFTSAALGSLFSAGAASWSLIPALTAPLFDGGANRARLQIAKVDKDIAVASYQKTIQTAFREVADGLAAQGTYQRQLAAQQHDTAAQQRRLDLERQLYDSGLDGYQNVLAAETALYASQQSLVTTQLNQLTSQVDLYRALGGGWKSSAADPVPPASQPPAS